MSKTQYVLISGKVNWDSTRTLDHYNNYTMTLILDKENEQKYRDLHTATPVKMVKPRFEHDQEEAPSVIFRRRNFLFNKGEKVEIGPPKIFEADGETPFDDEAIVGPGSDVTIKLEVYTTSDGKNVARMRSVRVDNYKELVLENKGEDNTF